MIQHRSIRGLSLLILLLALGLAPSAPVHGIAATPGSTVYLPFTVTPLQPTFWYSTPTSPQSTQQPRLGVNSNDIYLFSPGRTPQLVLKNVDDALPVAISPGGRYLASPSGIFDRVTGTFAKITLPPTSLLGGGSFWRPDGKRIAYEQTISGVTHFFTANPDLTAVGEVLVNGQPTKSGTWSPDGTHLVVKTDQGFYVTLADGSQPVRVADTCIQPMWSPDGKRIACVVADGQGVLTLFVVGADSTVLRNITPLESKYSVPITWSPDSTRLAYRADDGLRIVSAAGSTPPLASRKTDIALFTWSPDGRKLAYATNEAGYLSNALYVINADGTGERQLVGPVAKFTSAFLWSPDSTQLVYAATNPQQAYRVDVATGVQQALTTYPIVTLFGYGDNGQTLYALSTAKTNSTFLAIRGTSVEPLLTVEIIYRVGSWLAP